MLLEFSVKNYRSFREKVTLSMVASPDTEHLDTNTFEVTTPSRFRLLKSAAIYGANASGKTNLYRAAAFMERLVRDSATRTEPGDPIGAVPFRLDPATRDRPSEFEISFIAEGQRYVYGFTADSKRVHEEWLTAARSSKSRPLFHRHQDGSVAWGNTWRGERERLRKATRDNALLLSFAAQYNNPTAMPAYEWFARTLADLPPAPEAPWLMAFTVDYLLGKEWFHASLLDFLAVADLGIDDVEGRTIALEETERWHESTPEARELLRSMWENATARTEVRTRRKATDGSQVLFDLADESAGTRRLFSTAFGWIYALRMGGVLLIDEFESKLHPLITRSLLRMAHQSPENPQVIFTTHDCSLLDADILRRDQVWFTEKNQDGATDLYSLWDYKVDEHKVRKDDNYRIGYLQGRYGAIPFVGEFNFGKVTKA